MVARRRGCAASSVLRSGVRSMLRGVALPNCRPHADLRVELDDLTAIVGPNGSGKSAVAYRHRRFFVRSTNRDDAPETCCFCLEAESRSQPNLRGSMRRQAWIDIRPRVTSQPVKPGARLSWKVVILLVFAVAVIAYLLVVYALFGGGLSNMSTIFVALRP